MLLLSATAGACALAGARDLATFAVAFETASLPIVGLVALRRDDVGAEAGVKLLLTAVLSFGLLALGLALLYASTGSLMLGAGVSDRLGDLRLLHALGPLAGARWRRVQAVAGAVPPLDAGHLRGRAGVDRGVPVHACPRRPG